MAVTLISLDAYVSGSVNIWYAMFPAFWFLTWLLNDYSTFSYRKQWGIHFLVVFSLMTFLDKEVWVNWSSALIHGGLAVILASVGVLSSWQSRR
ncbi:hypothetical protein P7D85_22705 [Enterococcus hulanensis]|uniref:Uncharacterized protein n=1 Tax=Enterococcus hulanensis TaxID=2559929 RepID=A0ABU3F623_9ENTE|nr:hypothetical protein [Enterococcus hulanensis]MDT2602584.1 hypothetical protein [Enterococcus hulanensis]MDT2612044.1 hypothetical protein [Enterococcus hulanensis]MDT2619182.1 hypothetical protein [Enterococcus hulanensis]MDT2630765.1 hypothetical protein [Enterococcus hulanensis]MDT2658195.1 hypothetical protein [Enterococcus hulanensis]